MNPPIPNINEFIERFRSNASRILPEIRQLAKDQPGVPKMPRNVAVIPPLPGDLPLGLAPTWSRRDGVLGLLRGPVAEEFAKLPPGPILWDFIKIYFEELAKVQQNTAWTALSSLVRVILDGLCGRLGLPLVRKNPGRIDWRNICGVLALPAAILDYPLINAYLLAHYQAAKALPTLDQRESRKRTANSRLHSARSIFAEKRQPYFVRDNLVLPCGLDAFLLAKTIHVEQKIHYALTVDQFEQLLQAIFTLQKKDPPVFILLLLALYASTRAAESLHATTKGLISSLRETCLQIGNEENFRTKNRRTRRAKLARRVYRVIKRMSKGHHTLVHDLKPQSQAPYDRAVAFLKAHGVTDAKPLHYLRRIYASALAELDGLAEASAAVGHSSLDTTFHSYLLVGFTAEHARLWKDSPNLCLRKPANRAPRLAARTSGRRARRTGAVNRSRVARAPRGGISSAKRAASARQSSCRP